VTYLLEVLYTTEGANTYIRPAEEAGEEYIRPLKEQIEKG